MDTENEDFNVEQETVEVEETTAEEVESQPEDTITLTREKFKAMQEKAIKFDESLKKPASKPSQPKVVGDIPVTDLYALMEAKVPQEDVGELQDWAKMKGVSIAELLKTPLVKAHLSDKQEKRRTAGIAHSGSTRRGTSKVSDEDLLSAARSGNLKELSDADLERLVNARK